MVVLSPTDLAQISTRILGWATEREVAIPIRQTCTKLVFKAIICGLQLTSGDRQRSLVKSTTSSCPWTGKLDRIIGDGERSTRPRQEPSMVHRFDNWNNPRRILWQPSDLAVSSLMKPLRGAGGRRCIGFECMEDLIGSSRRNSLTKRQNVGV